MGVIEDFLTKRFGNSDEIADVSTLLQQAEEIFLVNTSTIHGYTITAYFDMVCASEVFNATTTALNFTQSELARGLTGNEYMTAIENLKTKLKIEAYKCGANAVIQAHFSYEYTPAQNPQIIVFGEGTPVTLSK
jgi:uncharacterized protein YbjQ (UPF0145 family)